MSDKDAFYFGHDSNAKDDPKIIQLIEEMGLEGYGIYWVLLELMRDQPDYKYRLNLVPAIARRYNTTFEKVKNVIAKYGLFVIDEDEFYSIAFINRMSAWDKKKKAKSEAGKKGNEARWGKKSHCDKLAITDGMQSDSETIAIKERKEKERKEKEMKEEEEEKNLENENLEDENKKNSAAAEELIINFFNKNCGSLKKITKLNEERRLILNTWYLETKSFEEIKKCFEMVKISKFLIGKDWATFDWIIDPENRIKILEGQYLHDKSSQKSESELRKERIFAMRKEKEKNG